MPAQSTARLGLRWQSEARHGFFTPQTVLPPHLLVAATNYWTKLVAATNTSGQICDLLPPMTEMDIESTGSSRNEIGPQDRYFLPDPGFTPGHDRDAYRVTQVRAPIFLSRNEDFQLFSTFFRFFHPFPKTEVERGGKRWNANAKRVETGETDSTLFHLFPPYSTSFHLFPPVSTLKLFPGETLL